MDLPIDILSKLDVINLIAIAAMLWVFNSRLDKKFEKIESQINKLDEKLTDVDRRLCRLEGAFASKDCCMIKDDRQSRKAE